MLISPCGLVCSECRFFDNLCAGCHQVQGKTFWAAEHTEEGVCPLFACSAERGLNSCGVCPELPCRKFYDLKDPDLSDEAHKEMIQKRVDVLRGKEGDISDEQNS